MNFSDFNETPTNVSQVFIEKNCLGGIFQFKLVLRKPRWNYKKFQIAIK